MLIDLGLVAISFVAAYLLRFNFELSYIFTDTMRWQLLVYVLSFVISFAIFKPYSSIIRHSGLKDGFRVFYATILSLAMLTVLNGLVRYFDFSPVLNYSAGVLLIAFHVTLFSLIVLRLAVRLLYTRYSRNRQAFERFLIFGAGELGLTTLEAIQGGNKGRMKAAGFIDDNTGKVGKLMHGIRIYDETVLEDGFLARHNIVMLVLAVNNLQPQRRVQLIEKCLELKLEVRSVPRVEDWTMGQLKYQQINKVRIEDLLSRDVIHLNNTALQEGIQGKVVLLTGAAGSIGSELARQLYLLGPSRLVMVDNAETPLFNLEQSFLKHNLSNGIEKIFVLADVTHHNVMHRVFSINKPDVVFHAAAYKHVPVLERNPLESIRVNVFGTFNMVELSKEFDVRHFVFVSTDKAVNPTSIMGASKRIAELLVQRQNLDAATKTRFMTTRFGNVLGSNGSVVPIFERQIAAGGPVTVTHPDMVRYFMTIPEACSLVLEASMMGHGGEIFVFDMGEQQRILDLAMKMIKLSGLTPGIDIDIIFTGLRPGEKLYEELFIEHEENVQTYHPKIMIARPGDYPFHLLENRLDKLREALNCQEITLTGTIVSKIVPEYFKHYKQPRHQTTTDMPEDAETHATAS